jgi:hypothetical protein
LIFVREKSLGLSLYRLGLIGFNVLADLGVFSLLIGSRLEKQISNGRLIRTYHFRNVEGNVLIAILLQVSHWS